MAAGKSRAAAVLKSLGARILDADKVLLCMVTDNNIYHNITSTLDCHCGRIVF